MLINLGRRTVSREEEERRREAFLQQHAEQRLAGRVTEMLTPEEKVFMRALRPERRGRRGRLFGASRGERVKPEPVFTGDAEADLMAETRIPAALWPGTEAG